MPLKLANLSGQLAETDFPFAGESVHIVYRPNFLTPAVEKKFRSEQRAIERTIKAARAKQKDDPSTELPEVEPTVLFDSIIGVIESWDVLDDDNQPLPIIYDSLNQLPYTFLTQVMEHCMSVSSPAGDGGKGPRS
jgi:hypothetical protein